MAGYLDRLVQRARPDLRALPPSLPAPTARHAVTMHDPFDAEPVVTAATWPSTPRSHEPPPPAIVTDAPTIPLPEPRPVPLRSAAERVVVQHASQQVERERVIEHTRVTLETEAAREAMPPPVTVERRLETQLEKAVVERDVEARARTEPSTMVTREHTREVMRSVMQPRVETEPARSIEREQVQLLQPSEAPVLTPTMQPTPIAREQVAPRRDSPKLVIGQLVVEVAPRAPAPAPAASAPPPQVVVVRPASTPSASVFHRGFGLGQS